MMGTFQKVSVGQKSGSSPANSAAWLNAVTDATNYYQNQVAGGTIGNSNRVSATAETKVKVKNITGQDLKRGHLIQLGSTLLNELDHRNIMLEAEKYDKDQNGKIGLIRLAVKDNKFSEAQLSGISTALVNVTDIEHRRAKKEDGAVVAKSSSTGELEILSDLDTTGEQEVAVIFSADTPSTLQFGVLFIPIGPASISLSGSIAATPGTAATAIALMEWNGATLEHDGQAALQGINSSFTELRASIADPILVQGYKQDVDGTDSFVVVNVFDFRALPEYDKTKKQIPYHDLDDETFKLGGEDC